MTLDDDGPPLTGALSDARKEQIKLRAAFLNGIGMGVMLIGVFTPVTRLVYDDPASETDMLRVVIPMLVCFFLGAALHLCGGWILKGLKQ
ncbi:hypothetical protein [Rhizobium sp. SAFR-030]|uniref:hypothetical protein n=1 Tax=Rhizobium sp. SAFR-030 TaxID=3387277 RepID=UPI003F8036A8